MQHIQETIQRLRMSPRPIILIDIDGVMQDNIHRLPHICEVVDGKERKKKKPDWATYVSLAEHDTPGAFCAAVQKLQLIAKPVYLTARVDTMVRPWLVERIRELTREPYPITIMREPQDNGGKYESASTYKRRATQALLDARIPILFAVDDSHKNCLMFQELGIVTLRLYNHLDSTRLTY